MNLQTKVVLELCSRLSVVEKRLHLDRMMHKEAPPSLHAGEALLLWTLNHVSNWGLYSTQLLLANDFLREVICVYGKEVVGTEWEKEKGDVKRITPMKVGLLDFRLLVIDCKSSYIDLKTGESGEVLKTTPCDTFSAQLPVVFHRYMAAYKLGTSNSSESN